MFTIRGCVQQRCSPYFGGSFKGDVEPERLARAPVCSAKKKKKRQDPSKQGKKKQPEDDPWSLPPDTASLHLQYANLLGMDPRVAMKRVIEEGLPLDDDFVMALRETRQAARDNLTAARMMASNSEGIYSDDDMKSTMEESVEEAKAMLRTTSEVLRQLEMPEEQPQEPKILAAQRKIQPRVPPAYTQGLTEDLDMEEFLGEAPVEQPSTGKKKKKLDLYQQMDAMLDSIRDGTFKSKGKPKRPSSGSEPKKPEPSLAARPELYSSEEEEEESSEAPTMADYEDLLSGGPRTRESVSDPQPRAANLPPTPPPPLSARPSMETAAATRVAEEEKERKALHDEMERELRAVALEEKLFPRPAADDEFLQMDTVAVAKERLQLQQEEEEKDSAPGKPRPPSPPKGSSTQTRVEVPKVAAAAPEVLEPLKGPPQKANAPSEVAEPVDEEATSIDDVIQEALGVPRFLMRGRGQKNKKKKKKSAALKVSKAVLAGKEEVAGKALLEMREKISKPVPKITSVGAAAYFQTRRRHDPLPGSSLPHLRDTLILLEEEDPNRLQEVNRAVTKPERKHELVKAQTGLPSPMNSRGNTVFKSPTGPKGGPRLRSANVKPGARPAAPPAPSADLPWASKYRERRRVLGQKPVTERKPAVVEPEALEVERPVKGKAAVKWIASPANLVREAAALCSSKERITASTSMVCGAEGAVVKYAPGAVGLLPFALMSAHTIAKVSEAAAKVLSDEQEGEDDISEEGLLSQLEHMGSIPFVQPVNVVVHSVEAVRPADSSSASSIFRIQGFHTSPNGREQREKQDTVVLLSEVAAYGITPIAQLCYAYVASDLKQLDVLAEKSADLDPVAAEIVLLSESLTLEAEPVKEDWRGGSNIVTFSVPDLPLLNKSKALMSTEYNKAPSLRGVVMESDAADKGLQGILSERKVSGLGLETVSVEVVKGAPVKDGCIPLRWCLSDQDVLACKLVPATGNSESISLSACPDEIQRYLQQVAQCKSIHSIALGEVKVVQEPCTDSIQMFLSKTESEAEGDKGLMEHSVAVYSGNLVVAIKLQSTMLRADLDAALRKLIC